MRLLREAPDPLYIQLKNSLVADIQPAITGRTNACLPNVNSPIGSRSAG